MTFFIWIAFNLLRPIEATFFGFFAFIKWKHIAKKNPDVYNKNRITWESIDSFESLVLFFKKDYHYKYDLGKGLCDHDSSKYEWYMAFGDCDDAALYAMKKLKQLGYKASRYGMFGKKFSHFDTLFKKDGKFYLFNYGSCISGNSKKEIFNELFRRYGVKKAWYCKVWY